MFLFASHKNSVRQMILLRHDQNAQYVAVYVHYLSWTTNCETIERKHFIFSNSFEFFQWIDGGRCTNFRHCNIDILIKNKNLLCLLSCKRLPNLKMCSFLFCIHATKAKHFGTIIPFDSHLMKIKGFFFCNFQTIG